MNKAKMLKPKKGRISYRGSLILGISLITLTSVGVRAGQEVSAQEISSGKLMLQTVPEKKEVEKSVKEWIPSPSLAKAVARTISEDNKLLKMLSIDDKISDLQLENITHITVKSQDVVRGDTLGLNGLEKLTNLSSIRVLRDLSINSLDFLKTLTHLRRIEIDNVVTPDLSPLTNLVSLTNLSLGFDGLDVKTKFNLDPISKLENLTLLVLHNANLDNEEIQKLGNLKYLEYLDLGESNLRNVDFIKNYPNLTSLVLSGNKIHDIRPLIELKSITYLDLFDNQIPIHQMAGINPALFEEGFFSLSNQNSVIDAATNPHIVEKETSMNYTIGAEVPNGFIFTKVEADKNGVVSGDNGMISWSNLAEQEPVKVNFEYISTDAGGNQSPVSGSIVISRVLKKPAIDSSITPRDESKTDETDTKLSIKPNEETSMMANVKVQKDINQPKVKDGVKIENKSVDKKSNRSKRSMTHQEVGPKTDVVVKQKRENIESKQETKLDVKSDKLPNTGVTTNFAFKLMGSLITLTGIVFFFKKKCIDLMRNR